MSGVLWRYRPVRRTDRRGRLVDRVNGPPAPMTGVPVIELYPKFIAEILADGEGSIGFFVFDIFVQESVVFVHPPNHEDALTKLGHPVQGRIQGKLGQTIAGRTEPSPRDSPCTAARSGRDVLHDKPQRPARPDDLGERNGQ